MDALLPILGVTVPFFALVLAGYLASWRHVLPESAIPGLNAFVLYFALPCMLFRFGLNTPIGEVKIPYEDGGDLPVLRPPKVRIAGLRVAEFKPLQNVARLELDLGLTHQQASPLGFGQFDYNVALGGKDAATGTVADAGTVAAGAESTLTLPLNLDEYLIVSLEAPNTGVLTSSLGTLDAFGRVLHL